MARTITADRTIKLDDDDDDGVSLMAGVTAQADGFDIIPNGWYHVSINEAGIKWVLMSETAKPENRGKPRLALTYTIHNEGKYEGRKLFDSVMFTADLAGWGRSKLEVLNPDVDWDTFRFPKSPDDVRGVERLKAVLVGAEAFALTKVKGDRENVAKIVPTSADVELADFSNE
jgi:hypothetical protein